MLWYYVTPSIETYTAGTDVFLSDFDLGDIVLKTPSDFSIESVPVDFTWEKRSATPDDSYQWALITEYYDPLYASPVLGYADTYFLTDLPDGVLAGYLYRWEVWVYRPDGGFGVSYEANWITLTD